MVGVGRMISYVTPSMVSTTGGVELTPLASMAQVGGFGELTNGLVQVESGSTVRNGVSIALLWHSTTP